MKQGLPADHGLAEKVRGIPALMPGGEQPCLTDVQYQSLEAGVARRESVLISAPTSTGKTLIGLWALGSALLRGQRAVYLVSHRALAKQKFDEIVETLSPTLLNGAADRIVIATGDGVHNAGGHPVADPLDSSILVATYEEFLHCLATAGPPRDMSAAVIVADEIQLIGDKHRGANVELLLTLLKTAGWGQFVALSAVLSPRDATELSEWLGVQCVRNTRREKNLEIHLRTEAGNYVAKVEAASEAQPIGRQQRSGARDTLAIVAELVRSEQRRPVIVFCMRLDDTYNLAQEWAHTSSIAETTVAISDGADISNQLIALLRKRTAFHNAEISDDERDLVEKRLASGQVDVVFATTTLAAGVNFPLGSAVFDRFKRWSFEQKTHEPIGRAEFQNMAGRVGRMGQAAETGFVVLSAAGQKDTQEALKLIDLSSHEDLKSRISPDDFGQLVLHIFAGKLCSSRDAAYDLLSATFSASRELNRNRAGLAGWREKVSQAVDDLIEMECLIEGRHISATMVGTSIARTGLKPATVLWLLEGLHRHVDQIVALLPNDQGNGDENALAVVLAQAALTSPEFDYTGGRPTRIRPWRLEDGGLMKNPTAKALEGVLLSKPWTADTAAANGTLLLEGWISGSDRTAVEALVPGVRWGSVQTMGRDVAWILSGLADVIQSITAPNLAEEVLPRVMQGDERRVRALRQLARAIRRQASRFISGLPPQVLWLTAVEQQGPRKRLARKEILALFAANLTKPLDLMRGDPSASDARAEALRQAGNTDGSASSRLRDAVRTWKLNARAFFRRLHERWARENHKEAIVRELYESRGNDLESALEGALTAFGLQFERLDDGTRPGSPDYLITVENFDPIVVEVKSKQGEQAFVGLNACTEVLAASELIGHRDSFCLTICSPAVDPSIAGLIENSSRLCVVEVGDLCGALLRLDQRRVSPADLYNWLTTPGVATMQDLGDLLQDA